MKTWKSETDKFIKLKKYYKYQPNFRVKCREETCQKELQYVDITIFAKHFSSKHKYISKMEEKYKNNINWTYFMLTKEQKVECILCNAILQCESSIDDHLRNHHLKNCSRKKLYNNFLKHNNKFWPWKYQTQVGDFDIKCKHCGEKINFLLYWKNLKSHIHWRS